MSEYNGQEKINELKTEGYDPVYMWNAEPGEEDPDHTHPFDTHLVVLQGEIVIRADGVNSTYKSGQEIDIPREKVHYAKAGIEGCTYIVAEKH